MENNYALFGILAIVLISVVAAMFFDASITGDAYLGYYGRSKVYGGDLKAQYKHPATLGKSTENALFIQRNQEYMLAHKNRWQCTFDSADGPYPCMYDDTKKKWCCIPPSGPSLTAKPYSSSFSGAPRMLKGLTAAK